jgi:hypothetical protein
MDASEFQTSPFDMVNGSFTPGLSGTPSYEASRSNAKKKQQGRREGALVLPKQRGGD